MDRLARFESGATRGFIQGFRKMLATDHGDRLEWTHAFMPTPPIRPEAAATLRRGAVAGAGYDLAALGSVDEVPTPQ